jgi:hypothetical protein
VRVHATLVKRGQAVARCSLEDVQPFRIVEVPLWMLDAAACCKIQASKCKVANVESLRELKALLQPTRRIDLEFAIQTQHPCLLDAGGADVSVIDPTEVHPTRAVYSPESDTGLDAPRTATHHREGAGEGYGGALPDGFGIARGFEATEAGHGVWRPSRVECNYSTGRIRGRRMHLCAILANAFL